MVTFTWCFGMSSSNRISRSCCLRSLDHMVFAVSSDIDLPVRYLYPGTGILHNTDQPCPITNQLNEISLVRGTVVYLIYGLHRSQGEGQLTSGSELNRTSSEAVVPDGNAFEPLGVRSPSHAWDGLPDIQDGTRVEPQIELTERTQLLSHVTFH